MTTRLVCRNCNTTMEGRFTMGRLFQLTPEQLDFVELFVRCEGKLSRMQEELSVSYPTVRSRLDEIIRALGYTIGDAQPVKDDLRQKVLEQLARKEITSEEALRLLEE